MVMQKQLRVHDGSVEGWKRSMPDDNSGHVMAFIDTERDVKNTLIAASEKGAAAIVWIPKEHIENLDIRYALLYLNCAKKLLRAKKIKRNALRMGLTIDGYNQDPRELWEIKEVRQWVSRFVMTAKSDIGLFNYDTKTWLSLCFGRDLRGV